MKQITNTKTNINTNTTICICICICNICFTADGCSQIRGVPIADAATASSCNGILHQHYLLWKVSLQANSIIEYKYKYKYKYSIICFDLWKVSQKIQIHMFLQGSVNNWNIIVGPLCSGLHRWDNCLGILSQVLEKSSWPSLRNTVKYRKSDVDFWWRTEELGILVVGCAECTVQPLVLASNTTLPVAHIANKGRFTNLKWNDYFVSDQI